MAFGFKMKISLCRLLRRILHVKLYSASLFSFSPYSDIVRLRKIQKPRKNQSFRQHVRMQTGQRDLRINTLSD